jgi:hypothetical protein
MKQPAKIQCVHPEGKTAPAIAADTYTLFEKAIYHTLKARKKGLPFTELVAEIEKCFKKQKTIFKGSTGWYAVHVKNHMEATGIIKTFTEKGTKIHALA